MVYQKHSRVTMEDNLHLMKWNLFIKSKVLPILELHHYDPRRMGKLSELIALLRKLYKLLLPKAVIGNTNWIRFCWATEILPIVQEVKRRLSFFFLGPLRTSYNCSRYWRCLKARGCSKMKPCPERKNENLYWCETKSQTNWGADVLVKHTGKKEKLTSYWTNDLFTVTKVKGPTIIVRRKRDGKVFTRNISMVKKYKHISDSDDHLDIASSNSAGINAENPHPDNRERNTDSVENVDSANNVRRSSRTQNPPIRFGEAFTHWKKIMKVGRIPANICWSSRRL